MPFKKFTETRGRYVGRKPLPPMFTVNKSLQQIHISVASVDVLGWKPNDCVDMILDPQSKRLVFVSGTDYTLRKSNGKLLTISCGVAIREIGLTPGRYPLQWYKAGKLGKLPGFKYGKVLGK